MITLQLQIHLLSDAEPGTGLGHEAIDALVPTDARGKVILPASHLKGLLRDQVRALAAVRRWPEDVEGALFGEPGDTATEGTGVEGLVTLSDATTARDVTPLTISRTRIGPLGTAHSSSLRTVQAIPAKTVFSCTVRIDAAPGSVLDLVLRLALMSIEALGGGRTRGAGACRISIDGEERSPGALLRLANDAADAFKLTRSSPSPREGHVLQRDQVRWFRLVFTATTPICCPDVPINGSTNHVRSGPVIPASAVQGALISRLDRVDSGLATACLRHAHFRAWPLVPVRPIDAAEPDPLPLALRVDLAHRMSKLKEGSEHRFADPAVDGRHWSENPSGSPLKSSDGFLRRYADGTVELWRAVDLPRHIAAHGVHHDPAGSGRRNLYSVEALAPMVFTAMVALPEEAASRLEESLASDPSVAFGKARSVRGTGTLAMTEAKPEELFSSAWPVEAPSRVFVVQSPIAIPDDVQFARGDRRLYAEELLAELAMSWGTVELRTRSTVDGRPCEVARTVASCGVRFGWNRHGVGTFADPNHRRLRARRVFLPGSVIVFKDPIGDLESKLLAGIGEGREEGFGCLLPHPGIATKLYRPHEKKVPERLSQSDQSGKEGYALFRKAGGADGPSPSQIATLANLAKEGPERAREYLANQKRRGAVRHWHRWEPVAPDIEKLLRENPANAPGALRVWQDLAVVPRPEREEL